MVGTDETTELWWLPHDFLVNVTFLSLDNWQQTCLSKHANPYFAKRAVGASENSGHSGVSYYVSITALKTTLALFMLFAGVTDQK